MPGRCSEDSSAFTKPCRNEFEVDTVFFILFALSVFIYILFDMLLITFNKKGVGLQAKDFAP